MRRHRNALGRLEARILGSDPIPFTPVNLPRSTECTILTQRGERSADSVATAGSSFAPDHRKAERPPSSLGGPFRLGFPGTGIRGWTCLRSRSEAVQLDTVDGAAWGLNRGQNRSAGANAQPVELDLGLARRAPRFHHNARQCERQVVVDLECRAADPVAGGFDGDERRRDRVVEILEQGGRVEHTGRRARR